MILTLEFARERYPNMSLERCEDPRHRRRARDSRAAAVVDTGSDIYAVCASCRAAINRSAHIADDDDHVPAMRHGLFPR